MSATNGTANGTKPVEAALTVQPNDAASVPGLIQDINSLEKNLADGGNEARLELAAKAKALWMSLETPRETMIRHCWAQVRDMLLSTIRMSPKEI